MKKILKIVFSTLWIWVLLSIVINSNLDYPSKQPINIIFCFIIALFILLVLFYFKKINFKFNKKKRIIIFFIVLLMQTLLFNSILFKTGWDSSVIFNDAIFLRDGAKNLVSYDYYLVYPNNVFICSLYYWIVSIFRTFSIVDERSLLLIIAIINSVLSDLTCLMIYSLLKEKTNDKYALFGYVLSLILLAFNPWNIIPYSDQLALIIPICIYYVYERKCNLLFKYLSITLLSILGYLLKPQSIIIVIAIIIVSIFSIKKEIIKKSFKPVLISILTLVICVMSFSFYCKSLGFINNYEQEVSASHYIMMGLNNETYGTYSQDDVDASVYCENKEERVRYNLDVIKERVHNMGVTGLFDFFTKKLCITFSDGTFSWGKEGDFYQIDYSTNTHLSSFFKKIFYNEGDYYFLYSSIKTICWFVVLLSIVSILHSSSFFKDNIVLILTVIGVIFFQLLFETRARYLLVNVPLLIIIAMTGLYSSKLYNNVDEKNK